MRAWQCPSCVDLVVPEPCWAPGPLKELDAGSVVELLDALHGKLIERGARVSLYLVGGTALLLAHARVLATPDVDVAHSAAWAELAARELALERGLAMNWLNASAGAWVPPRPECARRPPENRGLTVHLAPARHLLAMKLVAWRPKDEDDLVNLLYACGLERSTPEEVAEVLFEVYSSEDSLSGMLGVRGADLEQTRREAVARARDALRLL